MGQLGEGSVARLLGVGRGAAYGVEERGGLNKLMVRGGVVGLCDEMWERGGYLFVGDIREACES